MNRIRHTPEPIVGPLRDTEAMESEGKAIAQICKKLGVSEQTTGSSGWPLAVVMLHKPPVRIDAQSRDTERLLLAYRFAIDDINEELSLMPGADFYCVLHPDMLEDDGIHPTPEGHDVMRRLHLRRVTRALRGDCRCGRMRKAGLALVPRGDLRRSRRPSLSRAVDDHGERGCDESETWEAGELEFLNR